MGTRGAAVARVIPVFSGHPQGHPFKSGRVHQIFCSGGAVDKQFLVLCYLEVFKGGLVG